MSRSLRSSPLLAAPYGMNDPGFDNTDPADQDAMLYADRGGLLRDTEEDVSCVFDRAGMSGETHVDSAMRNSCMYEAGFQTIGMSDDSFFEV